MGGGGKRAFSTVNAASPTRLLRLPSAGEARRDELLAATLERQTERLRLGLRARLERDAHDQAVDTDPEALRVDPQRDQCGVLRVLDLLDDLAVEHEGGRRDLAAADASVEGSRLAAGRAEEPGLAGHDARTQHHLCRRVQDRRRGGCRVDDLAEWVPTDDARV